MLTVALALVAGEGTLGLGLAVILFCIYFFKSFHRLDCLSRFRLLKTLASQLASIRADPARRVVRVALRRRNESERDDSHWILLAVANTVGRHRSLLSAHALPVHACKEWMRFKRVVALHAQPLIGSQLQKLVYEVLQVGVVKGVGPVELAAEDFVEDNHLGAAEERSFAAGHLIEDDAKGPEVRKGA